MVTDALRSRWPSAPSGRVLLVVSLLLAQVGVLVWFGGVDPDPALGRYPEEEHLAADYDAYVGERVSVDGRVVALEPVTIRAGHPDGSIRLRISDVDRAVSVGDTLRVHGVVEPGGVVRSTGAVVETPTGQWYAWGISFLAGLWVLGRVLRYWRFDRARAGLRPREGGEGGTDA